MSGGGMGFYISAFLGAGTDIEVKQRKPGEWALHVGSYPQAGGKVVLFADTPADLLRLRDTITEALAAEEDAVAAAVGDGVRQ